MTVKKQIDIIKNMMTFL